MTLSFLALAGLAVAFAVTVYATPPLARLALRRGWTDRPDGGRKAHRAPTPSIGGVAIFAGAAVGMALVAWATPRLGLPGTTLGPVVFMGAIVMALTGAIDDARGLGFKTKLAIEAVVAVALVASGYAFDLTGLTLFEGREALAEGIAVPLTLLWAMGVMNAVNLIDGVDGLAGGVAAIAFASLALAFGIVGNLALAVVAAVFVGALGGFLVHNFNPASIFMGDSGSLFLGYALAVYTLAAPASADPAFALLIPGIALGLPILDTALSMIRRGAGRQSICAPDRDHIHHRMVDRMPTRRAVLVLYGVAAMFGVLAVMVSLSAWTGGTLALGAAAIVAAILLLRLGYVRLPYAPPSLQPMPAVRVAVPTLSSDVSASAAVAVPTSSGDGLVSPRTPDRREPTLGYRVGTA